MADLRKPTADQRRIRDDLEGIVRGDVLFDDITRTLYSTDASLFEVRPLGVVAPRDEEDVRALVRYAAEHEIPLIARGAGTGLAGGALGGGLIVDLGAAFAGGSGGGQRHDPCPGGSCLARRLRGAGR